MGRERRNAGGRAWERSRGAGQAALVLLLSTATFSFAQSPNTAGDTAARHLVRTVIQHELKAEQADQTHWMYLDHLREPSKDEDKEVVETKDLKMEMVTAINGHPISAAQRKHEVAALKKEVSDPSEIEAARRADHEDGEKARRMLKMLPDAFLYEIKQQEGDRTILSFRPDPAYEPPTREATVFHAMAGIMVLNTREQRLEELSGRLMSEVKFGWGILGHIDPGGHFLVKQREIAPGHWQVTELDVQMSGKALFFKSISLHQQEARSDFRQVPGNLAPEQALAMLASQPPTVAQVGK